jgi:glucose-1-phosphate thymidylyltransferase
VTYIPQEAPLGLAHAVMIAEDFIAGDPFVMYLGDNVLLEGVSRFVAEFERHRPNAQILLIKVPEPERFGVAVLEGERVTKLVEKPTEPLSDLALVGVYLFDETVFEAVKAIKASERGELEITDAIQYLIDSGRTVRPEMVTGWWKDTGRPEDLLDANRMLLSQLEARNEGEVDGTSRLRGRVVIEEGAKIVRSQIEGPAIIGANSVVEDSTISTNTSVSFGCTVRASEIADSVVMEQCVIEGVRTLERSILGKGVEVRGPAASPGAPAARYRLIVGDQGRIDVAAPASGSGS